MSNFEIREGEDEIGSVLILKGAWTDEISTYMKEQGIYGLRLTDSFGFKGQDLSFLPSLDFLRSLELYCWEAKGVEAIESLNQLEVIGLQYKSTRKLDLSSFNKLRVAKVTWSKGLTSLLNLPSVEKCNIQNYPHSDLIPISAMKAIKKLYITSRKLKSLQGIESLTNLELLDLYNCPALVSLAGSERCQNLKTIEVEASVRVNA